MSDLTDIMKNAQEAGDAIRQDRTLHELVARWRGRAETSAAHSADARTDLSKLEPSDARYAPTVARHSGLSMAADVWGSAADELERVLKERDER